MSRPILYAFLLGSILLFSNACHNGNHKHEKDSHEHSDHEHDEDGDAHDEDGHEHNDHEHNDHDSQEDSRFNQALADRLGADQYGMKTYVIAFLKDGPNRSQDSTTAAEMQTAHMDNINRLAEEGILVMAGPFYGDGPLRGIYIFDVETIEAAEELTKTDPMIQEGRLIMELKRWYGSAALKQMTELHNKIAKEII